MSVQTYTEITSEETERRQRLIAAEAAISQVDNLVRAEQKLLERMPVFEAQLKHLKTIAESAKHLADDIIGQRGYLARDLILANAQAGLQDYGQRLEKAQDTLKSVRVRLVKAKQTLTEFEE